MAVQNRRYEMLQSCVALRNILVQLDSGSKVTLIPGKVQHKQLKDTCKLLEQVMLANQTRARQRPLGHRKKLADIKPLSVVTRKIREKQRKTTNELIDKYFEVHGKPIRDETTYTRAKKILLREPQYLP